MSLVCAKVCASTQRRLFLLSGPAVSLHTPSQGCQVSLLPFTALCQAAPQRCPPCTPINKALADAALLLPSPLPACSLQLHSLSSVHHLAVPSTWPCSSPGRIQHGRGPPAASALLCSALPQRRLREAQPAPPVLFLPLLPALQPSVLNPQALLALSAPQDVPMPCDTSCFPHPLPLVLPSGWEGAAKGAGMGLGGLSRCPGADSLDVQHPTASSDLFRGSVVLYPARGGGQPHLGSLAGTRVPCAGKGSSPRRRSPSPFPPRLASGCVTRSKLQLGAGVLLSNGPGWEGAAPSSPFASPEASIRGAPATPWRGAVCPGLALMDVPVGRLLGRELLGTQLAVTSSRQTGEVSDASPLAPALAPRALAPRPALRPQGCSEPPRAAGGAQPRSPCCCVRVQPCPAPAPCFLGGFSHY